MRCAVFFGERQASEWAEVLPDGSTPCLTLTDSGHDPRVRIYTDEGELAYEGAVFRDPTPLRPGDQVTTSLVLG